MNANETLFGKITEFFANETLFGKIIELFANDVFKVYNVCLHYPPHILSDGLWANQQDGAKLLLSTFPIFLLQCIVISATTHACHSLLNKFHFPMLVKWFSSAITKAQMTKFTRRGLSPVSFSGILAITICSNMENGSRRSRVLFYFHVAFQMLAVLLATARAAMSP
ncbi:hypothetical protein RIF29_40540 [Crotalaria pallida]|uniref:Uncharacterized protein n=1 Tax=Crotalaria pallida TaxID=3830 RepID=A0AAN9E432_CROPI